MISSRLLSVFVLLSIGVVCMAEDAPAAAAAAASSDAAYKAAVCYICNSNDDPSCDDPFSGEKYATECSNGETFCRKIVQNVDGVRSVVRQCAKALYKENYEGCYKSAGKATQQVCTCKGNSEKACNSANYKSSSLVAIGLFALLAALVY